MPVFAPPTTEAAVLLATLYQWAASGSLQDNQALKASFFSSTAYITAGVYLRVPWLPLRQTPKMFRPQLLEAGFKSGRMFLPPPAKLHRRTIESPDGLPSRTPRGPGNMNWYLVYKPKQLSEPSLLQLKAERSNPSCSPRKTNTVNTVTFICAGA